MSTESDFYAGFDKQSITIDTGPVIWVRTLKRIATLRRLMASPDVHFESIRDMQREMNALLAPYEESQ